jgi:hypothetical protein
MTASRLAWSLCTVALLLVPTGPVLLLFAQPSALYYSLTMGAVQMSTAVVGAVVASRLPRNAVGWILLTMGAGLGLSVTASAYGTLGISTERGPLPADNLVAWAGNWTFIPVVFGGVLILLHVFPDGRFLSDTWRRLAQLSAVVVLSAATVDALQPGELEASNVVNPLGATGWLADVVTFAGGITDPAAIPTFGLAAAGLVVRFRRSRAVERQQIKWISFALALVAVGLGVSAGAPEVAGDLPFLLALAALATVPVAIGVAMLRYRLYDIDVVINRTLVYAVLTATLGTAYLGSVLLLQLLLNRFTQGSSLAIAVSTLAVATLFRPARARIQDIVDRRFFRNKYDAGQTLDRFATHMRDQVDLTDIGSDLLAVVAETVQPRHVSLWLREREVRP